MDAENYYDILGIRPDADDDTVKHAYREQAKTFHPDRNPGDQAAELRFKLINTAYDALKDAARRESYNEYLAFNEGRQQSERRQWGRLFAVIALLLIGPSIVFFSVFSLDTLWFFDGNGKAPVTKPLEQPEVATEPAAEPPVESEPQTGMSAVRREALAPLNRTTLRESEVAAKPAPEPEPAPAPRTQLPPPPAIQPAPAPETAEAPPAPQPGPPQRTGGLDPFADTEPGRAIDAPSAPAVRPNVIEPSVPREIQRAPGESDARASARLLAKLKEPDGASTDDQVDVAPRQDESGGDTFSDCRSCPLMSLGSANAGRRDVAVSQSEITIAEWNLCVQDGVCPPYPVDVKDERSAVKGLTPRIARAYANWLSAVSGQEYRVMVSRPEPGRRSQDGDNCDPDTGGLSGFDWLDEQPRANKCPPGAAENGGSLQGFRVARKIRRQG